LSTGASNSELIEEERQCSVPRTVGGGGGKDTHFCHSTNFQFSLQRKRSSISETKTRRMRLNRLTTCTFSSMFNSNSMRVRKMFVKRTIQRKLYHQTEKLYDYTVE